MTDLIDNDNSFHFYFETRSSNSFIENNASYDINNRFICELIDAELNSKYSYYRQDGLIDYEINEKGIYTDYEYNENKQLISIQNSDKTVNYYYDENTELLTKIVFGDMTYNFVYDEYLSPIKIEEYFNNQITNRILIDYIGKYRIKIIIFRIILIFQVYF